MFEDKNFSESYYIKISSWQWKKTQDSLKKLINENEESKKETERLRGENEELRREVDRFRTQIVILESNQK